MTGDRFLWHHDTSFFQQDEINGYAGGVHRRFAPLGEAARKFAEDFVNSPGTREIVTEEDFGIGCHQIRITADDTVLGRPAPEGFHHDGFDVVGVTCVAVENVSGGISLVRETSTSRRPLPHARRTGPGAVAGLCRAPRRVGPASGAVRDAVRVASPEERP